MDIQVLGPVVVRDDGREVSLGPGKLRTLLALLVLRAPARASDDEIAEVLWDGNLPDHPAAAVYTYISRLRAALGGRDRVERSANGYRLRVDAGEIDVTRFEMLRSEGEVALVRSGPAIAAARFREALRLFRGEPYSDVAYEAFAQAEIRRLAESRLGVLAGRIAADLALGRHATCVAELEALVTAYPTREIFARQLVLARYRSGRHADALAVISRLRASLADGLGVEPDPETVALERRVLDHDPTLAWPPAAPAVVIPSARVASGESRPVPPALEAVRQGPFVGRDEVLTLLETGTASMTLLVGEAGIGKTRLAAEVAARVARFGTTVWFGRCHEHQIGPYEPIAEAIATHLDEMPAADIAQLGPAAADLARLVPDLALPVTGIAVPPPVDAGTARVATVRAIGRLAGTVERSGDLLIVLDDLHWATPETIAVLECLLRDAPHGRRVLATIRDDGDRDSDSWSELRRRGLVHPLRIGGLGVDEVAELAATLGQLPEGAGRWLHDHTGGNPLFVCEVMRGGGADPSSRAGAPSDRVRSVVDRRLGALDAAATEAVAVGAVAGVEFHLDLIVAAAGEAILDGIDRAIRAGVLREAGRPGTCAFVHGLIRDVVLERLGPGRRRRIHAMLGTAVECSVEIDDHVGRMTAAHHLGSSGDASLRRRAVRHAVVAAEAALVRHDFEEAVGCSTFGIQFLEDPPDPVLETSVRIVLTEALDRGGYPEVRDEADRAIAAARRSGDPHLLARAALLQRDHRPDEARAPGLRAALEALGPSPGRLRARLLVALGWDLAMTGADSAALVAEGRTLAATTGDLPALAHALVYEGEFSPLERDASERLADATDLLSAAEASGDQGVQFTALNLRANALLELGDLAGTEEAIAAHERLAGGSRILGHLAGNAQRRAMRAILRGEWSNALRHAEENVVLMGGDPSFGPIFVAQVSAIRRLQGRPEGLAELIESDPTNRDRPVARACRSVLHAECGRADVGRSLLRGLVDDGLDAVPGDMFWMVTMALIGEAATALGDADAGHAVYGRLIGRRERLVTFGYCAVCWGSVERFLAPLAVLLGRPDAAIDHYEASIDVHRRIGAPAFLAMDRIGLARVLRAAGCDAARADALLAEGLAAARDLELAVASHAVVDAAGECARTGLAGSVRTACTQTRSVPGP